MSLRKPGLVLALCGWALVALMTLEPRPGDASSVAQIPPTCLVCGRHGGVDVILNVLLFVPLGAGLALGGLSIRRAVAIGAATTLAVELLQVWVVPGRDASLSDLLTNTTGTAVGAWLAAYWPSWVHPGRRVATRLAAGWGLLWLGQAAVSGWALQPDLPSARWYGQHAPELGQFDRFTGRFLSATLNGRPLPSGPLDEASIAPVRASGHVELAARATAGTAPGQLAPVVSIFDRDEEEVAVLGRRADALVFRASLRARRLRLHTPAFALPGAYAAGSPDDTTLVRGGLHPGQVRVEVERGAASERRQVALSPHLGWALIMPYEVPLGRESGPLSLAWIAAWMLPLGWWWHRAGRAPALGTLMVAALGAGLWLIPHAAGAPPALVLPALAAIAGLALGVLASRRLEPGTSR